MSKVYLSSSLLSPVHFFYAVAKCEVAKVIPNSTIVFGEWGCPVFDDYYLEVDTETEIELVWFSFYEKSFYGLKCPINEQWLQSNNILFGCGLFGKVSVWSYENNKSALLTNYTGRCVSDEINAVFDIDKYEILLCGEKISLYSLTQRFKQKMGDEMLNIILSDRNKYDKMIEPYLYRYCVFFSEENMVLDYVEDMLYDGAHDKLHDGGLMKYHLAGKQKKLAIKWHVNKSEYFAFFWFNEKAIRITFEHFYGIHHDTKTDFIIHIDANNQNYELSLYRYGLKEPVIIPKEAYQLIVFKNKFEDYRSDNYNQESGAWIW